MNIIVSAGGTGGHIYPALAIINKFKEYDKDLNVLYIGTHNRMEKDIVPKLGIKYEEIEIYGFSKTNILRDFKTVFLILKAIKKCKKIMKDFKPDVVIGAGGYVTFPVILAASSLNIKTVLHEQNSIPGKVNKLVASKADLVCTSYENSNKYFTKAKKVIYTGNPCGENALKTAKISKKSLNLSINKKLVLIVSGSLGSQTINNKFMEFLSMIDGTENYEVLYITGKDYHDKFKEANFSKNVKVLPYLEGMSGLFGSVDLIISRAGAGTISEILACKVPSILIPSPYVANNHQYYNAKDLSDKKVSILVKENELNVNELYKKVSSLLEKDNKEYKTMKDNLDKLSSQNSSTIICDEIRKMLK